MRDYSLLSLIGMVQLDFRRQSHRHLRRVNGMIGHGITLALAEHHAVEIEKLSDSLGCKVRPYPLVAGFIGFLLGAFHLSAEMTVGVLPFSCIVCPTWFILC